MSNPQTVTITLDPTTADLLTAFAAQFSQSIEGAAAALLAAEMVRGTDADHGPELAGRIFTRGEILHLDLAAERSRSAALQTQVEHLRREVARIAQALAQLAA